MKQPLQCFVVQTSAQIPPEETKHMPWLHQTWLCEHLKDLEIGVFTADTAMPEGA